MNATLAPPRGMSAARAVPIILIVELFFLWSLANNLNDVLISRFKGLARYSQR